MPFKIIRNDITKVRADAIVNTANPEPFFDRGTDQAIYQAAGKEKLLSERKKIGRIAAGEVAVTPAFNLHAKYIIHTVGPVWVDGNHRELELLASCYRKSLLIARQLECRSIAFPLISTGVYGFPKDKALDIALGEFSSFLAPSDDVADGVSDPGSEEEMDITLVVFDRKAFDLSSNLTAGVEQYIDENYVDARHIEEYGTSYPYRKEGNSAASERRRRSVFERLPFGKRRPGRPVSGTSSEYGTGAAVPPSWGQREESPGDYLHEENLHEEILLEKNLFEEKPPEKDIFEGDLLEEDLLEEDFFHSDSVQEPFQHTESPQKPFQHAESLQDVSSPYAENRKGSRPSVTGGMQARSLQDVISQAGETFQESLLRMIDERGLSDTQVYKRANIDRRLFSKIRSNKEYNPKRQTAVSLALALELNMDETRDLLGRAGMALSTSSKFDLIISYCIQNGIYDIIRINAILFDYGQPLLGA